MFLIIAFIATALMLLLVLRVGKSLLHPASLMLLAWLAAFGVHFVGLIDYEYEIMSQSTCMLVITALAVFTFGSLVPLRVQILRGRSKCENDSTSTVQTIVVIALLLGLAVYAVGIGSKWREVARGGYSLSDARVQHWDKAEKRAHTPITLAMAVTRPCSIFLAFSLPLYLQRKSRLALASIAAFGLLVIEGLSVGGRSFMAYAIIGSFFTAILVADRMYPWLFRSSYILNLMISWKTYVVGLTLFAIFYAFFVLFPVARNPRIVQHLDSYMRYHLGTSTHISPRVERLSKSLKRSDLRYFAYESRYLSSPLMRMNYLMNETDAKRWFFLGGNNFTLFSKVINLALQREGYSLRDVKSRIEASQPYGQNPWICGLMDVVVDFGLIGSLIFMLIFGWLSSCFYDTMLETGDQEQFIIQALLCICIVSFPFTSRFPSNVITLTSLMAVGLIAFRYVSPDTSRI